MVICVKVIITCAIIWIVQCCIVEITDDKVKNVLPNWFYTLGVVNVFIGVVLAIVCILYATWM